MYVCICSAVTQDEVLAEIVAGADSEEAVGEACLAGTSCGSCLDRICALISLVHPEHGKLALHKAG